MIYRFRYTVKYPWSEHPANRDIFAETRIEADAEIHRLEARRDQRPIIIFDFMTESGTELETITAGEKCLYRDYAGALNETTIFRCTKNFLYIVNYQELKFRRDGSEVAQYGKRHLYRYDKKMYDDYWKGRADRERLNNMKRVDWLHVPDKLFDEIYAQLEAIEFVPHVENVPIRHTK